MENNINLNNKEENKDNIDFINIEPNQDFTVQPSLKSLVSSTKYLNHKVHKYKSEKERIKQLEYDVYNENGHINTGSITLHQGSSIDYEITDETDKKAIVSKEYVDSKLAVDVDHTVHFKDPNVSIETDGAIIVHKDTTGIISSGNIVVQDLDDEEVISLSNDGKITAKQIALLNGTIENPPIHPKDIVNMEYVDSKFNEEYLSKKELNLQTVKGPVKFEGTLTLDNGTIENEPSTDYDIANKLYVDNKFNEEVLLKNETNEQTVNGPVKFNNTTKIAILSLPIVD